MPSYLTADQEWARQTRDGRERSRPEAAAARRVTGPDMTPSARVYASSREGQRKRSSFVPSR